MVELVGITTVDSPGVTCIEESCENHYVVNIQLDCQTESSLFPEFFTCRTGVDIPVVYLSIDAAQIHGCKIAG